MGIVKSLTRSLLSVALGVLLFSCNSPSGDKPGNNSGSPAPGQAEEVAVEPKDSLFLKISGNSEALKVSAAKAAGVLRLKAPSETLQKLLGKADSTAVDMCKDLSFWYSAREASLSIYSLCDNDLDMRKSIQMIRISGYPFTTAAGISEQSTYEAIGKSYPGIIPVGKYIQGGQTVFVADDIQKGIAFELSDTTASGKCLAILVHLPEKGVTATNIPLYPGLEKF